MSAPTPNSTTGGIIMVGAHPDDETLAGGTLATYTRQGLPATVVCLTRGGLGHMTMPSEELKRVRTREAEESAAVLGAQLLMYDYEDGAVPHSREVAMLLVDIFRSRRPSVVVTLPEEDKHPDHRNTQRNVLDAFYLSSLPLVQTEHPYYCVPQVYTCGRETGEVYIDITETIDTKIQAAMCHHSQFEGWLVQHRGGVDRAGITDYREAMRSAAAAIGWRCRVRYAEVFKPMFPAGPRALRLFPESEQRRD